MKLIFNLNMLFKLSTKKLKYLNNPRYTVQFKVDLNTGKTVESKQLKRYDPKGVYNRR